MLLVKLLQLKLWKKKPVLLFTAVFFLMLLILFFKILQPNREYLYDGRYAFTQGVSADQAVVYDQLRLPPGVYLVNLSFISDTDLNGHCNVKDGTVFDGALLCNGEHIYSKQQATDFHFWLFEGTEQLQITISYNGEGTLAVGSLYLTETNLLWTMLLCCVLAIGLAGYLSLFFYYYQQTYSVSRECKQTFLFLCLITLAASVSYLSGYTISGGDLTYHLMRIEGVKDGLSSGFFPVRLEPEWLYGHGYANGIFYCNTFLYLPALLRLAGFPVSVSYNLYCVFVNAATAVISYYCFSRILKSCRIGLLCSALYSLSIIRIYKLVITSAVGESNAFVFLPLVFYGLYRIFCEDPGDKTYRSAWVPLMLGYAGLMQTHVLSCEVTAFVTLLFCIIFLRRVFCKEVFLSFVKAAAGSVLLSLWFLVPFLDYYLTQDVHIKHVAARTIQAAGLQPAHLLFHFWQPGGHTASDGYGVFDSHPSGLGLSLIAGTILFLILWLGGAFRKQRDHATRFMKITAIFGCLLSILSLSIFPWDTLQSLHPIAASLISSLQFPNRFLGWATLCMIAVLGSTLSYLKKHSAKGYLYLTLIAVFSILTSGLYLQDYVNARQNAYRIYNEEGMGFGYISGAEYLIEGTDQLLLTFADPVPGEGITLSAYTAGSLRADFHCSNLSDSESHLDLPLLYYKGYQAHRTDTGEALPLTYGENNVIRVLLPAAFDADVSVSFQSPVYWRISELISLLTGILLLATALKKRRKAHVTA